MEYKILKTETEGGVAVVKINRPEAMNALNRQFFNELEQCLLSFKSNDAIKALIIIGEGKSFVAGADISEMATMTPTEAEIFSKRGQEVFRLIGEMPYIIIAAVNGFALGGGMELAMACDFRIASTKAKFGQPEVGLGIIPGYAGTQRLSRLTNISDALYLITTAEIIDANKALEMRIVQKLCDPEQLLNETIAIANNIASKGPQAVKLAKKVIRQGYEMPYNEAEKLEAKNFALTFNGEANEGMKAFLEKRKPNW